MRRAVLSLTAASLALSGCALLFPAVPSLQDWTGTPTSPRPEFRQIADRDCVPALPFVPDVVIQDQRGDEGALFVFRGEGQDGSCPVFRYDDGRLARGGITWGTWFGADALERRTSSMAWSGPMSTTTYSDVVGGYPPGTVRVVIDLDDGTSVEATVEADRYAAWWPTDAEAVLVRALDAAGATIATIPTSGH